MGVHGFIRSSLVAIVLAAAGHTTDTRAQAGDELEVFDVEVSADGLHRVDPALLENTWLLPEADLSLYTHAFVMPAVLLFREMGPASKNAWQDRTRTAFPVSEIMQERLRETFGRAFSEAMQRQRDFDLAEDVGRDVILVQAYMTEIATGVPPEFASNNVISVRWIWEALLTLEIRDSMSNQILARMRTRERVDGPVDADRVYALAPQLMQRWANRMVEQLNELSNFYPSRLYRLYERATQESGQRIPAPDE